jgi:hypothetical protein
MASSLIPASGTGKFWRRSAKIIRFCRQGCTNRPFYQIVVMEVSSFKNQLFHKLNKRVACIPDIIEFTSQKGSII